MPGTVAARGRRERAHGAAARDGRAPPRPRRAAHRSARHPGQRRGVRPLRAILEGEPYPVRALISFGGQHAAGERRHAARARALERLEFFAQIELVHTPTSRFADVLLPAASWMESRRSRSATPTRSMRWPTSSSGRPWSRRCTNGDRTSRSSSAWPRLGLGEQFWDGDVDAGYASARAERAEPGRTAGAAVRASVPGRTRALPEIRRTRREPWRPARASPRRRERSRSSPPDSPSTACRALPDYVEPALSPRSRPDLAARFPLVLTNAKRPQYMHSQLRGLPSLRKTAPNPPPRSTPTPPRRVRRRRRANGSRWRPRAAASAPRRT